MPASPARVFLSTPRDGPLPEHSFRTLCRLFGLQLFSALVANSALVVIVAYALLKRALGFLASSPPPPTLTRPWDDPLKWKAEKVTKDYHYYARNCGLDIVDQEVETSDGYFLNVWKVVSSPGNGLQPPTSRPGGYPVLIQHGLFQSAGSFITSEERSLAFWLTQHGYSFSFLFAAFAPCLGLMACVLAFRGYQVYLGNNRGVFNMGHRKYSRSDPRFWDFNIKELALCDLPAMVDHVLKDTGYSTLAFIGHSQGNATMFCSLAKGMIPDLSTKISCFIALAPAVYCGPLTTGFPFGLLKSMRWRTWRSVFGVLDFLPIMRLCVEWLPSCLFGFFGYQMFAFLFNWTDANWLLRRKSKMFRFTPSPVSSASIFWWTGYQGFSTRGCVLDPNVERWFDEQFPPLALYHGGKDKLVLTEPLVKRIETHEPGVKIIRNFVLEEGEHCDHFWHVDAAELCFGLIIEDIESTRPAADVDEADLIDLKSGRCEQTVNPQHRERDDADQLLRTRSNGHRQTRLSNASNLQNSSQTPELARDTHTKDRDREQVPVLHVDREV